VDSVARWYHMTVMVICKATEKSTKETDQQ